MGGNSFQLGSQTGGTASSLARIDPLMEETVLSRPDFNWNRRDPVGNMQRNPWTHLWPRSGFMGGDNSTPWGLFGDDHGLAGTYWGWAPNNALSGYGSQNTWFFYGVCVDDTDVPIANPIVQAFRTSDDEPVGATTANNDGTYQLGVTCPSGHITGTWSPSQEHYLVAYKDGSPDVAGTTVNTLTPTTVEG